MKKIRFALALAGPFVIPKLTRAQLAESLSACYTNNNENAIVAPGTGFLSSDNSMYDLN
jgi:hypothetical protein